MTTTQHDELVAALRSLLSPQIFGTYNGDPKRFQAIYPVEVWEAARAVLASISSEITAEPEHEKTTPRRPQRTNMWTNVNATNPHFAKRGW